MKRLSVALLIVLAILLGGCGSGAQFEKGFFQRKIVFTLTPEAQQSVGNIVSLLEQSYGETGIEPPLPDSIILPVYVAADLNRDHEISDKEARIFEKQGILIFEDQLGGMRFRSQTK
ncbi:MAG: hypothetical protein A2365_03535 [Candidatus Nealsonbacteria bacterium RIFOXYB1_FULL_40_15]|uniref:Uncharacterized protein n=2 Tax=Candidatus Nealsoniibacteriota TaxID=1817911 RepID=A0A1G2ERF5_9BACT|nr:MAG: hypothetical protein A2365_03535 [Candidatus Nealsonbacteria bacterium RIFOXYB1_FULL_40_15]OGZ28376.1 MAG: hypothetical protein A2427_01215 [Candidatus Nealsonbacteria bacterium RIFOXYC1_FULL_40_7]OGZ29501.1 MAG: hypothetical protein A2562_02310 [Candidatus Nealsonbacteria bacterium RIFOXYD1_FULL_39_11]